VLVDDPRPAEAVLVTAAAGDAPPHYYLTQLGATYRLLADDRAAPGAQDAVVAWLERPLGADYAAPQREALARLRAAAAARGLAEEPDPPPLGAAVLGAAAAPAGPPLGAAVRGAAPADDLLDALLGAAPAQALGDGRVSEALWTFLYDLTWRARGGAPLNLGQAFALHAARFDLGAPVGPNRQLSSGGQQYNYQALARDTVYNLGDRYREVQVLSAILPADGVPPQAGSPARALLDATYAAAAVSGAPPFDPRKRFHLEALRAKIGPPLGRDAYTADRGFIAQVFAGDTLYAPASQQTLALFLGRTAPADPAYTPIWTEVYRRLGLTYDPNAPFHKVALQERLGMPITGVQQVSFEGVAYQVQVFAYDTLFAGPDRVVRRLGKQEEPEAVRRWTPVEPAGRPWPLQTPRPNDPAWPAPPAFSFVPTGGAVRDQLFGRLEWRRTAYGRREVVITNDWAARNLVNVQIPQLAGIVGGAGGRVRFHRIAADQLRRLWRAWEDYGLLRIVLSYDGDFVPRTIASDPRQQGYNVLSNHAYGVAFDINARWNGYGVRPALVGQQGSVRELVELANIHGFYWGGHWPAPVQDGMHFEWAREA
jgi:hypothetical protein